MVRGWGELASKSGGRRVVLACCTRKFREVVMASGETVECCPRFDPGPWDERELTWTDRKFVKERVRSFLHIPFNFGSVMQRNIRRGVVDFKKYVEKGGVFEGLKDVEFSRGFSVNGELGTLTWADEIDIAPETLYAEATGGALPDWMESRVGDRMEAPFAGDDLSCAGTRRVEMEPSEIAFEERLRDSIRESIGLGYNPIRITEMLDRHGGKGTAERLVRSGEIQDGLG
jgi:hypothetical protein